MGRLTVRWILQFVLTLVILSFEGMLHLFWIIFPLWRVQRFLLSHFEQLGAFGESDPRLEMDFMELLECHGYTGEEHFVNTQDDYVLGLHRIVSKKEENKNVREPANRGRKKQANSKGVVFFQHGFMQNSESWIVRGPSKALAYTLVDLGYDVWLGNNRGNKYSYKHKIYTPMEEAFWNFSIDDFAHGDLPAMLHHVLEYTGVDTLSYIGFSQGTAQAFACFSINTNLANRVNMFVALAPAARVKELQNPVVSALATSRPNLVFLLLGRKAMLPETLFWRKVLAPKFFVWIIDFFLKFLFGWSTLMLDPVEKPLLYSHLYSYSSVKALVHWFQITETKSFQAFDDTLVSRISQSKKTDYKSYMLPSYNPARIPCPIALFWGGKDTVPDMEWILSAMPENTFVHKEDDYEHLDFMWAKDSPEQIDSKVINLLKNI